MHKKCYLIYTDSRHKCVQKFKQNLAYMDFAPNFRLHIGSELVLVAFCND